MIQKTIAEIEAKLAQSCAGSPQDRANLRELLARLKQEVQELAKTREGEAREVVRQTPDSADELAQAQENPEQLTETLRKLEQSVAEFEGSHPGLVQLVNRIATTLANMGI